MRAAVTGIVEEKDKAAPSQGPDVHDDIPGFVVRWPGPEGEEEGPLAVLWNLIEAYKVDIFDISIHRIAEDFLDFVRRAGELRIELASSFTVMAARLLYYKSRALLPDPGFEEPEADTHLPPELVQQLLEYRRFQLAADKLRDQEHITSGMYVRQAPVRMDESGAEWLEVSVVELIRAYSHVLGRLEENTAEDPQMTVVMTEYSVDEKMAYVQRLLKDAVSFSFDDLFENIQTMDKNEVIATFLALLELVRESIIVIQQRAMFGEIRIFKKSAVVR
ncbi:MAG: segregation/condensation protein A [Spirochaetia bacterium]|nr:segregation/condensation protein A [Spirochaetia bacterium]